MESRQPQVNLHMNQSGGNPERRPLLVSKREAATLLSLCLRSIDNLIAAKQLSSRRIGKRVLIPYTALVEFARRDHPNSLQSKAEPKTVRPEKSYP